MYRTTTGDDQTNAKLLLYFGATIILLFLSFFESMKDFSYISMVALTAIVVALVYVVGEAVRLLGDNTYFDRDIT